MERQEETKKKILRRRTTQSSFPLDLVSEILLRLPAKPIVRSRCVSKDWSAITTDPHFINSFKTRYSNRVSTLIFLRKDNELFVFSIPQNHPNSVKSYYTGSMPIGRYQMKSLSSFSPTESVHGFICFQDSGRPIVWNPTMRKFLALPKPEETWNDITTFLGYDPIEGKHKVMCMPHGETSDECRVLTLGGAQQTWRSIKINHKHRFESGYGKCINGVVYYDPRPNHWNNETLMSFDVRSEKFGVLKLPTIFNHSRRMLIPYDAKLGIVASSTGGVTLWILEDGEKHEWSCKHFKAHIELRDPTFGTDYHLDGITPTGEFIYVPWAEPETFHVLYFDPTRQSFREIEFADEEFRRRNGLGLGDGVVDWIHYFPDHVESLVSYNG